MGSTICFDLVLFWQIIAKVYASYLLLLCLQKCCRQILNTYSGRSLKSIFCFLIEVRGSFRSMQSELHEKLKVTRNCTHHDRKGFRAATAKMMRLMTIMVEATVTAKTGTKLSQEAQSVSPLPPRNETAKTSAQALLFLRVSFRHWTLSTSFILRPGLAFSAASSFSTKSHWQVHWLSRRDKDRSWGPIYSQTWKST